MDWTVRLTYPAVTTDGAALADALPARGACHVDNHTGHTTITVSVAGDTMPAALAAAFTLGAGVTLLLGPPAAVVADPVPGHDRQMRELLGADAIGIMRAWLASGG